jgi:hypothetical protein
VDERGFDELVRSLAAGASRRHVLRILVGASVTLGGAAVTQGAEAARRGFSAPKPPTDPLPCRPDCNGLTCGPNGCGGTCACPGGGNCICLATSGLPNAGTNCAVNEGLHPDAGCRSNDDCQTYGEPYLSATSSGACYLSCLP